MITRISVTEQKGKYYCARGDNSGSTPAAKFSMLFNSYNIFKSRHIKA